MQKELVAIYPDGDFGVQQEFFLGKPATATFPSHAKTQKRNAPFIKVPVACNPCNTQWMSRIQNNAKDILTSMLRSKGQILLPSFQERAATWAAMTAITVHYVTRRTERIHFPEARRLHMHHHHSPPRNTWVWLAANGTERKGFVRTELVLPDDRHARETGPHRHFLQLFAGGLGLFVFGATSASPNVNALSRYHEFLVPMVPTDLTTRAWPPPKAFTNLDEVDLFANTLLS